MADFAAFFRERLQDEQGDAVALVDITPPTKCGRHPLYAYVSFVVPALLALLYGYDVGAIGVLHEIDPPWITNSSGIPGSQPEEEALSRATVALYLEFIGLILGAWLMFLRGACLSLRRSLLLSSFLSLIGSLLLVHGGPLLGPGRCLLGIAAGFSLVAVPCYITEMSPRALRASFHASCQAATAIGLLTSYLLVAHWSGCGLSKPPGASPATEDPMASLRRRLYLPMSLASLIGMVGSWSLSPTPRERLQWGQGSVDGKGERSPWEKAQWTLQRITLDEAEVEEELQSIMDSALYSKGDPSLQALLGCREEASPPSLGVLTPYTDPSRLISSPGLLDLSQPDPFQGREERQEAESRASHTERMALFEVSPRRVRSVAIFLGLYKEAIGGNLILFILPLLVARVLKLESESTETSSFSTCGACFVMATTLILIPAFIAPRLHRAGSGAFFPHGTRISFLGLLTSSIGLWGLALQVDGVTNLMGGFVLGGTWVFLLGYSLSLGPLQSWVILDGCPMQARNRILCLSNGLGSFLALLLLTCYQGTLRRGDLQGHWGLAMLMSAHAVASLLGQLYMCGSDEHEVPPHIDEDRDSDFSDSLPRTPHGAYTGESVCRVLPGGRNGSSGGMGGAEALLLGSPGIKLDPPGYRRAVKPRASPQGVVQTREWNSGNGSRLVISGAPGSDSD